MPRSTKEWVAKHDDQTIPAKVKLRVIDRQRSALDGLPICPCCGLPIRDGQGLDFDHGTALADGGEHRESNIRAIHRRGCHQGKSAAEATARADHRTTVKATYRIRGPSKWRKPTYAPTKPKQLHEEETP